MWLNSTGSCEEVPTRTQRFETWYPHLLWYYHTLCLYLWRHSPRAGISNGAPASLHLLLTLQLKPSFPDSRALKRPLLTHLPFWVESRWRDGDSRGRSLIGNSVLITPQFGPFYRSLGAQSSAQPWHTDPLTPTFSYRTARVIWLNGHVKAISSAMFA